MKKNILFLLGAIIIIILIWFKGDILKMLGLSYRKAYNVNLTKEQMQDLRQDINIVEIKYKWSEPIDEINKPKYIVYHHTAIKNITAEEIDQLHKNKGWNGIGYHYYIRKNGTVYSGRKENYEGAHVKGWNKETIGICLEGNFEEEYLSNEQAEALVKLSIYLCCKYDITDIIPHKKLGATLCPGKNFPLDDIKNSVIDSVKKIDRNIK